VVGWERWESEVGCELLPFKEDLVAERVSLRCVAEMVTCKDWWRDRRPKPEPTNCRELEVHDVCGEDVGLGCAPCLWWLVLSYILYESYTPWVRRTLYIVQVRCVHPFTRD